MANFGVSIDEVWQQSTLVPAKAPSKKSPYTVPVEPRQRPALNIPVVYEQREGFQAGSRGQDDPYSVAPQQQQQPPPPPQPLPTLFTRSPAPEPPAESPNLKEQLNQQIDAFNDCQKDVHYLKSLVQTLKRELQEHEARRHHYLQVEKRNRRWNVIWMVLVIVFFIVVVALLVQMSQRLNHLLTQPLL